jgi:hypothetical protein
MKFVLTLFAALVCISGAAVSPVSAQCGQECQTLTDLETGQWVGYACVQNRDSLSLCTTSARSCMITPCSGMGFILDSKGSAVAQARICKGQLRGVESITVVSAREPATLAAHGRRGSRVPVTPAVGRAE